MLRKIVVLCIFLSCFAYTFAATKPQEKVGSSNSSTQTAQPDKRGTKDSPLVIDTRTIHSDEETAEEAQRVAEQQRVNTWNIRLTFVIAVCAFLQFCGIVGQIIVYRTQTRLMETSLKLGIRNTQIAVVGANAAELAARTSSIVQLPKLVIFDCKVVLQDFISPVTILLRPPVDVAVHNYGQTPAFIVSWSLGIAYKGMPQEIISESPLGKVIRPNTREWLPTVQPKEPLNDLEDSSDMMNGNGWYTVNGSVVYDDMFGTRGTFEFCRDITYRDEKIVISECGMSQANY